MDRYLFGASHEIVLGKFRKIERSENKEVSTELIQTAAAVIYTGVPPSSDGVLVNNFY